MIGGLLFVTASIFLVRLAYFSSKTESNYEDEHTVETGQRNPMGDKSPSSDIPRGL